MYLFTFFFQIFNPHRWEYFTIYLSAHKSIFLFCTCVVPVCWPAGCACQQLPNSGTLSAINRFYIILYLSIYLSFYSCIYLYYAYLWMSYWLLIYISLSFYISAIALFTFSSLLWLGRFMELWKAFDKFDNACFSLITTSSPFKQLSLRAWLRLWFESRLTWLTAPINSLVSASPAADWYWPTGNFILLGVY